MAKVQLAVGYVHVSRAERGDAGTAIAVQRKAIRAHCDRRKWALVDIHVDIDDEGAPERGDGLAAALAMVRGGAATALVVARVACLSRSVASAARTLEMARSEGWNLVLLDLGVDLSTAVGTAMAQLTAIFAELDHRLSSERTRSALVAARARGARLGRPPVLGDEVRARIRDERLEGRSLRAIARGLTADGVPTGHGGVRWHASTVRSVAARDG